MPIPFFNALNHYCILWLFKSCKDFSWSNWRLILFWIKRHLKIDIYLILVNVFWRVVQQSAIFHRVTPDFPIILSLAGGAKRGRISDGPKKGIEKNWKIAFWPAVPAYIRETDHWLRRYIGKSCVPVIVIAGGTQSMRHTRFINIHRRKVAGQSIIEWWGLWPIRRRANGRYKCPEIPDPPSVQL